VPRSPSTRSPRWRRARPAAVVVLLTLVIAPGAAAGPGPQSSIPRGVDAWSEELATRTGGALFDDLAVGSYHACGLGRSGSLRCWGNDFAGQAPTERAGPYAEVVAGLAHTCGILARDASLECWGSDFYGQTPVTRPGPYAEVTAGWFHTCAVRADDGRVECFGRDDAGQVGGVPDEPLRGVTAGYEHTCALKASGEAVCWGSTVYGEALPPAGTVFASLTAGFRHTCGILPDTRAAECFGYSGGFPTVLSSQPGPFAALDSHNYTTCGVRADTAAVECWGADIRGSAAAPAGSFRAVGAGTFHGCALRTDRAVECWGDTSTGQATNLPRVPDFPVGTDDFVAFVADTVELLVADGDALVAERDTAAAERDAALTERDAARSAPQCDLRYPAITGSTTIGGRARTLAGIARDDEGVTSVEVSVRNRASGAYLTADGTPVDTETWLPATLEPGSTTSWSRPVTLTAPAAYDVTCRVVDVAGHPSILPVTAVLEVRPAV
jgi:hypothetical protein